MTDTLTPLILDFLESVAARPRPYDEVAEAWRTSCPRLTVWEDAIERGLAVRTRAAGQLRVEVTPLGRDLLRRSGRLSIIDEAPRAVSAAAR